MKFITQAAGEALLISLPLLPLASVQAQQRPQLSVSAGPAYSLTTMRRAAGTPTGFRAADTFRPVGELRLAGPLAPIWALEAMIGLTELQPGIKYRYPNGSRGSGIGMGPLLQTGLSVRRLGLLTIGSRLSLDAALGAAGARLLRAYPPTSNIDFIPDQRQPAPNQPVVIYQSRRLHRNTVLLSGDLRLRYALTANRNLLLSLGIAQGLRPLMELRTQQLLYLDSTGAVQQGGFVVRERGSHVALQLGYGWLLGQAGERVTTRTPRYGRPPASPEVQAEEEKPAFSEPPTE